MELTHARNVGLFKYWTPSNLPLFAIAAPMLWIMIRSALAPFHVLDEARPSGESGADGALFRRLALPQLAVAVLAITSFHVQIVNRISSGYPLWYMHIARAVVADKASAPRAVRAMVIYALVQGALFAAFLPPA
jgi:phosphatidylinositol glycan class V